MHVGIQAYNLTYHVISLSQRLRQKKDNQLPLAEPKLPCKTGQMRQMSRVFLFRRFTVSCVIYMKSLLSSGGKVTN